MFLVLCGTGIMEDASQKMELLILLSSQKPSKMQKIPPPRLSFVLYSKKEKL